MKDIVWNNTLSVEVEEIDDDHRKLVELFNILTHAVADGDSDAYIDAVLEELITCTIWHFRHEERLMIKHAYPQYEAHRAEHAELVDSAQALQCELRDQKRPISAEDIRFLDRWLTGHILSTDMDLGAYLAEEM